MRPAGVCLLVLAALVLHSAPALGQSTRPASAAPRAMARPTPRPATAPGVPAATGPQWSRLLLSLGIVIAVIIALWWGGTRLFGGPAGMRPSRAMQVIARSPVAPRQHLMLIHVGRRLIVAANSGTQMNSLAEITDPDEVAEVLGRVQRERTEGVVGSFGSLFRHAQSGFEAPQEAAAHPAEPEAADPAVAATRQELSGLMEKVRGLSRTLHR